MREHSRQPANTKINKEHRTELRYTGRAPFENAAHVVQHRCASISSDTRCSHALLLNLLGPSVSPDAHIHLLRHRLPQAERCQKLRLFPICLYSQNHRRRQSMLLFSPPLLLVLLSSLLLAELDRHRISWVHFIAAPPLFFPPPHVPPPLCMTLPCPWS